MYKYQKGFFLISGNIYAVKDKVFLVPKKWPPDSVARFNKTNYLSRRVNRNKNMTKTNNKM